VLFSTGHLYREDITVTEISERRRVRSAERALTSTISDYTRYLSERGYAIGTIKQYQRVVAHFVGSLPMRQTTLRRIDETAVTRFIRVHLPTCRCEERQRSTHIVRAALVHYRAMLVVSQRTAPSKSAGHAALAAELNEFDRHLMEARGLLPTTRRVRVRDVRDFLMALSGRGVIRVRRIRPSDVAAFMTRYGRDRAPGSIRALGISLRSYFAFKTIGGAQTAGLVAALPRVAHWRLAGLPASLTAEEVEQLLYAFDRTTATGRRDYAITRCLLDLGLRRIEVARLRLEDVDWRQGTLSIHGKGRRVDTLPLPTATGRAIVEYLRHGRPQTSRREVFVRHRPPTNATAGLDIVRNAVRVAAARCGLGDRVRGTHILRHTLATRLVQRGARLKDIADVLRHRSIDTTTIYAKVDLPALATVALPWPGSRP
jgi:site-specific recombinase XerD